MITEYDIQQLYMGVMFTCLYGDVVYKGPIVALSEIQGQ